MKKHFLLHSLFFTLTIFQIHCGGSGGSNGGGGSATPTPTPVAPGDGGTVIIGSSGLCDPGEVARVDFAASKARFSLVSSETVCTPAKDNRLEEYTLIVYNTSGSAFSFQIDSPLSETAPTTGLLNKRQPEELKAPPPSAPKPVGSNSMAAKAAFMNKINPPSKYAYGKNTSTSPLLSMRAIDVGDEVDIQVRSDKSDDDKFIKTSAIVRGQGTNINLLVDRDVPFNQVGNEDSITTAQVNQLITIFDDNIYPLVTSILGNPSDVDGDSKINVVITPILNRNLDAASYTDPRNLLPFDPVSNPGSNEAETIFIYAPDSQGHYEIEGNAIDATEYVERVLNGWVAFQLTKLISYNQHVLVSDGDAESDWIEDGLGSVMADLCGFNIHRSDAALSLMAPQLDDLREADDLDDFNDQGMEYLFMNYVMQSQMDTTLEDADSNGIDDDIELLSGLMTSNLTDTENLENFLTATFDEDTETEFDAIFKDWTIAVATSGTNRSDLQIGGQTAVKYYFGLNQNVFGSGISNASGSVRVGADGNLGAGGDLDPDADQNDVGFDFNDYHAEEKILIENADEHVYAPGNPFYGYVDPFSAMYVRLSGLSRAEQVISLRGSSSNIKAFLVKRTNLSFAKTYSESIFGSIDQHPEDLQTPGPNPYWPTRLDYAQLAATSGPNELSQEFLSIIGSIDEPSQVRVCPEDLDECSDTDVPDTDKYLLTIPPDGNNLAVFVRRRFDNGSNASGLKPLLAVVSSKDVPYPYVPHPIRNAVNGVGTTTSRQQYRWITSKIICGDDQASGLTGTTDNLGGNCAPGGAEDSPKLTFEDGKFTENLSTPPGSIIVGWDGDILGGECNMPPAFATSGDYALTDTEASPSNLGSYPWSGSFMTLNYNASANSGFPDVLFKREFLNPTTGYPSEDPDAMYEPRSKNGLTLNCHINTGADPDEALDSPDDLLEPSEINEPSTLAEQILVEMSRGRYTAAGALESTALAPEYDDTDIFAIDRDSRDDDSNCVTLDVGNNLNTYTVKGGEGSILWGDNSHLIPHIAQNLNDDILGNTIYNDGGNTVLTLTPGKSYTLIVGGTGGTTGDYEIRIRKYNPTNLRRVNFDQGTDEVCYSIN